MVELGVFNVKEIPFGWCRPSVPGTRVIAPLDASKVIGLLSVDRPLNHPVQPQALRRAGDGARDGGAASNLKIRLKKKQRYQKIRAFISQKNVFSVFSFHIAATWTLPCNHSPSRSAESGSSSGCHSWTPKAWWSCTVWCAPSRHSPVCL